jgi:hypothetical protein
MVDSDALTGVGTRSGSTLDPKRMTAKERAALRSQISKTTAKKKTTVPGALAAAEKTIADITKDIGDTSLAEADAAAAAAAGLTSMLEGDIAANQARVLSGVKPVTGQEEDGDYNEDGVIDAADIRAALADFYAQMQTDAAEQKRQVAQSAYDLLFSEFDRYGLGALVVPLQKYIQDGISAAEFTIRLRNEPAYKKRFAANEKRITKGLRSLSEAEYIELEDQYQDVMRRYGMPSTYYAQEKDPVTGITLQPGFEELIAGDVSAPELEDRVQTAYNRVLNAAPQIKNTLNQYYGDQITNGDILAYVLDPENAINNIKRKVTAAEIGGAASMAGLGAGRARAEELGAFGITGEQARQGFTTISEFLPQAKVLGERYAKQGLGPYTQETAEAEVFAIPGSADAGRKRRKLAELETAQFSGASGMTGGALARERAGQF